MAPKNKFTKEEMVEAALRVVQPAMDLSRDKNAEKMN